MAAEYAGSQMYFIGKLVPSLSMHACAIWHGDAPSSSSSSSSSSSLPLPVVKKEQSSWVHMRTNFQYGKGIIKKKTSRY